MDEQPTCGRGLAAHAPLPEHLAEVIAATAAVLESHLAMLDTGDPHSAAEHAAYVGLVSDHLRASRVLHEIAQRMAGYRDLPMGRHVDAPEANAVMARAFERFVDSETTLLELLRRRLPADQEMLGAMGS